MVCLDLLEAIGNILKCGLPVHRPPLTALLEHGTGQTLVAVQGFIGKPVTVSNPAFVDIFVFEWHNPHDFIRFDLNNQVGTRRIVRTDGLAA